MKAMLGLLGVAVLITLGTTGCYVSGPYPTGASVTVSGEYPYYSHGYYHHDHYRYYRPYDRDRYLYRPYGYGYTYYHY